MNLKVTFQEQDSSFNARFGEVNTVSDGGYERGYAAGYEKGNKESYDKGHTDGVEEGCVIGEARMIQADVERVINDLVTNVRDSAFAYGFTFNLKFVYFKNATRVGTSAFSNCRALEEAYFDNVTSIGNNAFYLNAALTKLVIRTPTVCSLGGKFVNNSIANGTGFIYVPDNLVEQYKVSDTWSNHASQIKPLSELTGG